MPIRQQAITWTNYDTDLWQYISSPTLHELFLVSAILQFQTQKSHLNICIYIYLQHYNDVIMDSISNQQPHDCLLNHLFRRRSEKTSKLRITDLCVGNSLGTGEFPAQMANNSENISIWWRHHESGPCFPIPVICVGLCVLIKWCSLGGYTGAGGWVDCYRDRPGCCSCAPLSIGYDCEDLKFPWTIL